MLWAKAIFEAKAAIEVIGHFGASQWTAVFAGLLILTSLLQSIFICYSNHVAMAAANAAKKIAESLQATERAYVAENIVGGGDVLEALLRPNELNKDLSTKERPDIKLAVALSFTNYGKTPATLKCWAAKLSIDGTVRQADLEPKLFPIRILAPGERTAGQTPSAVEIFNRSAEQSQQLTEGSSRLWLCGEVEFEDIFGQGSKREFVWRYDHALRCFVPYYFSIVEQS
jgi:hypothetical protein